MVTATPEQVLVGYASSVALVRARVQKYAELVWAGAAGYRDADVDRLVAQIAPKVQAGQLQIANLTSAYIASAATVRRETKVAPTPVRLDVTTGRGVPAAEVYRRPAKTVYRELSNFLQERGITIERRLIGDYITSLEMAGCSITLLKLDDELTRLWDAPVLTPALRWGV